MKARGRGGPFRPGRGEGDSESPSEKQTPPLQENSPAETPVSLLLTHILLDSQRNKKKGAPKCPLDSSLTPED